MTYLSGQTTPGCKFFSGIFAALAFAVSETQHHELRGMRSLRGARNGDVFKLAQNIFS